MCAGVSPYVAYGHRLMRHWGHLGGVFCINQVRLPIPVYAKEKIRFSTPYLKRHMMLRWTTLISGDISWRQVAVPVCDWLAATPYYLRAGSWTPRSPGSVTPLSADILEINSEASSLSSFHVDFNTDHRDLAGYDDICLFVFGLRHSNSISDISWRWYDVWEGESLSLHF